MGTRSRIRQARLGGKLLRIRQSLDLSQNELLRFFGLESELDRANISNYELGEREPALYVILKYARAVGVSTDVLIDDELDLPEKLSNLSGNVGFLSTGSTSKAEIKKLRKKD